MKRAFWVVFLLTISLLSAAAQSSSAAQRVTASEITSAQVNGVYNPAACGISSAPAWCSGSDLGAWVNAAFKACSLNCEVHIPAGSYRYSTTISMTKPTQSLTGDGSRTTLLTYTGSSDGILWQMIPFTVGKAGRLRGIWLQCTSAATNCVHSGSLQGSTWEDLDISGATGPSANNVLLENVRQTGAGTCNCKAWTERTYMRNVFIGDAAQGGSTNLHFMVNGGGGSFGYNDIQMWQSVEAGQSGVLLDRNVYMYNSSLDIKGNVDSTNERTHFFDVSGGQLIQSRLNIVGETVNGVHPYLIYIGGNVDATGSIQMFAQDATASAGLVLPYIACPTCRNNITVEPFNAYDYPLGTPIIKGYQNISSDGDIVALLGGKDLGGRLILSWPNNGHRYQQMILDVACASHETSSCTLATPVNYAYGGQYVFSNPRLKELSSGATQVVVTIGNRNNVTQNVIATWFGSADETVYVLPGEFTTLGTAAIATGPTIASDGCGGSAATLSGTPNGTDAFAFSVGRNPSSTCTLTLPSAPSGWNCLAFDRTNPTTGGGYLVKETSDSSTSAVLTFFKSSGSAASPTDEDIIRVNCKEF